jgi:hypothetical protein
MRFGCARHHRPRRAAEQRDEFRPAHGSRRLQDCFSSKAEVHPPSCYVANALADICSAANYILFDHLVVSSTPGRKFDIVKCKLLLISHGGYSPWLMLLHLLRFVEHVRTPNTCERR